MIAEFAASTMKEETNILANVVDGPRATVRDGKMTKDVWKRDAYALEKRTMSASMAIEILHDPYMGTMLVHLDGSTPVFC
jgi:hypothetical protein